jgi:hypothetical protein
MNARTHELLALAAAGFLAVAISAPSALAQDPEAYRDGYETGEAGRVRYHEGGAAIVRAPGTSDLGGRESAATNAPLFPGDRIATDGGQRVEVELAGGTLVRIDRSTEVAFEALPRPYAKYRDNTVLGLAGGSVQIASRLGEDEEFRIDTPAGSVYLLGDGDFRIDASREGVTRVAARRGVAEVVGAGGSVLVRGGTAANLLPGGVPETPRAVHSFSQDGFDRWVVLREDAYRAVDSYASEQVPPIEELPYEVRSYAGELSSSGTWVRTSEYGWVWSPTVVVTDWRPYSDGYWAWGPGGYFWVSYEPWGWAPYRYGRWGWYGGRWCWIPGSVFGGAWVSWSWGSAWIGWAPLGYWGYPAYVGGPYYYDWYDPHCWTFVHHDHIDHHDVRRVAVPVGNVGAEVRRNAVTVRAPDVSPRRVARTAEGREEAARRAASDRAARVTAPTAGERRNDLGLAQIEERIRPRGGERAVSARPEVRTPPPGREGASRPSRGEARETVRRESGPSRQELGTRPERATPAPTSPYTRRIVEDPRSRPTPRSNSQGKSPERSEPQRVAPRGPTNDGRRDLYDRMSGPRRPREAPSAGTSAKPAPQRSQPERSAPRAAPKPSAPKSGGAKSGGSSSRSSGSKPGGSGKGNQSRRGR